jgi:flagellar motor protein MotB
VVTQDLNSKKLSQEERIGQLEREKIQLKRENAQLQTQVSKLKNESIKFQDDVSRLTEKLIKAQETAKAAQDANKKLRDIFAQINKSRKKLLAEISDRIKKAGFPVKSIPERGIIRLPEGKLFDKGKYKFSEEGKRNIETLVNVLSNLLPCYVASSLSVPNTDGNCPKAPHKIEAVFLEGHTDSQKVKVHKYAPYEDNNELAAKRALSAFKFINGNSVLNGLRNEKGEYLFGVSGYGETRPICEEKNKDCYNINRRIDLRFLMQSPNLKNQMESKRKQGGFLNPSSKD